MVDHVRMLLSIPPKYAVSNVVGYIKGKSATHLARVYRDRKRNFAGQSFWVKRKKAKSWNSSGCGDRLPPPRWRKELGRRKRPRLAASSGSEI